MDVTSGLNVVMNFYTQLHKTFKVTVEYGLRKSELGYGTTHHSTGVRMHFKYLNVASGHGQFRCGCHTAGTGADDRNF